MNATYARDMEQRVALCDGAAGEEIAYATVGEGPVLVLAAWWTSHLELDWQNEELRAFLLTLAEHHTVVRKVGESRCGQPSIAIYADVISTQCVDGHENHCSPFTITSSIV